jgi:hypothetical protein
MIGAALTDGISGYARLHAVSAAEVTQISQTIG